MRSSFTGLALLALAHGAMSSSFRGSGRDEIASRASPAKYSQARGDAVRRELQLGWWNEEIPEDSMPEEEEPMMPEDSMTEEEEEGEDSSVMPGDSMTGEDSMEPTDSMAPPDSMAPTGSMTEELEEDSPLPEDSMTEDSMTEDSMTEDSPMPEDSMTEDSMTEDSMTEDSPMPEDSMTEEEDEGEDGGAGGGSMEPGNLPDGGDPVPAGMQEILDLHNEARCKHNAKPLSWSNAAEATAQMWADELATNGCGDLYHSDFSHGFGENISMCYGEGCFDPQEQMEGLYESEITCGDPSCYEGHAVQILWKDTDGLGVATQTCNGGETTYIILCYDPSMMGYKEEQVEGLSGSDAACAGAAAGDGDSTEEDSTMPEEDSMTEEEEEDSPMFSADSTEGEEDYSMPFSDFTEEEEEYSSMSPADLFPADSTEEEEDSPMMPFPDSMTEEEEEEEEEEEDSPMFPADSTEEEEEEDSMMEEEEEDEDDVSPTPVGGGGTPAPAEFQELLDYHNQARCKHGAAPLEWSDTVAASAKEWGDVLASRCGGLVHSEFEDRNEYGENLQSCGPDGCDHKWTIQGMYLNEINSGSVTSWGGHATQILWKDTRKLGAAITSCGTRSYCVLQYDPTGNYPDRMEEEVEPMSKTDAQCGASFDDFGFD